MSEHDPEPSIDDCANRTARALRAIVHGVRLNAVHLTPAALSELRLAAREVLKLDVREAGDGA